jgi:hypothetical protein
MSGVADGQIAFERQVAAFLGAMADEIPDGRYSVPSGMIGRARMRVATTILGAVLLLAAAGVGGAMVIHALRAAIGSASAFVPSDAQNGSAGAGSNWSLGAAGAGSAGGAGWTGGRSQRYLGISAPGRYVAGLPGDLGPGRWGPGARYVRDRTPTRSAPIGRLRGEGGFGGSEHGGSGWVPIPPPIISGGLTGSSGGGWFPGGPGGGMIATVGAPVGPATAKNAAHHGHHSKDSGRGRDRGRDRG